MKQIGDPVLDGVARGQQITMTGSGLATIELRPELNFTSISGQNHVPDTVMRGVVTGFSLPVWNSDDEQLFFKICVPNRWDAASDIDIHIDCYLASAQSANQKAFKLQIDWEHFATGVAAPSTSNTITVETENIPNPTAQYMNYQIIFTGANAINYDIDGGGNEIKVDEKLYFRLRRIGKTGTDTEITGELVITHIGLIFQINKVGTAA